MDARRRVNVLFPNPQSLFDGFQVGFVNVGSGNLTFVRRDLVIAARDRPVVFARVHDSRIEENADFGKGWRLNLAEELHLLDDGGVLYTDSSGARYRFVRRGSEFGPEVPVVELEGVSIELLADKALLKRSWDGRMLTFKRSPIDAHSFLITRMDPSPDKVIEFEYAAGSLVGIFENGRRLLKVRRDSMGRVSSATDMHDRSVHYVYDANGLLTEVRDVAGDSWLHEYDLGGRLTGMVGGNGIRVLETVYEPDSRVREIVAGRIFEFRYRGYETEVSDGTGRRHTFTQNDLGATIAWSSTEGLGWRLSFDESNRVHSLDSPDERLSIQYNWDGSIAATQNQAGVRTRYDYDGLRRLTHRASSDPALSLDVVYRGDVTLLHDFDSALEFTASKGKVTSLKDDTGRIEIQRNEQGYVTGVHDQAQTVRLHRNPLQRIVATDYGNGFISRYDYDALGNRIVAENNLNSSVSYRHDSVGNIVSVKVTEADGEVRNQYIEIGELNQVNQVAYGDERRAMKVDYDGLGRPSKIQRDRDAVDIAYFNGGAQMRMTSRSTGLNWQGDVPRRQIRTSEVRSLALSGLLVSRNQAGHAAFEFNEATFKVELADSLALGVPNWMEAKALLEVATGLLRNDDLTATTQFEKPSNPIFQPLEYRSTNCCIPCSVNVCHECSIGSGYASWNLCFCESETLYYNFGPPEPHNIIDDIIEEYEDLGRKVIPSGDDFTDSASTENFTAGEYNSGDYPYFIFGKMGLITEPVRREYNKMLDNDPDTDFQLRISSGYRNPKKNDEVKGAANSRHQYGDAVDLIAHTWPKGMTKKKAYEVLRAAAIEVFGEVDGYDIVYDDEDMYVHIEWDPEDNED